MATLPPDPYAPDPVVDPDGKYAPSTQQREALPGPENPAPPKLSPKEVADAPVNAEAAGPRGSLR